VESRERGQRRHFETAPVMRGHWYFTSGLARPNGITIL
jgi:hypothetical protein